MKDLTVILRLWLDPSDVTLRGRLLVPASRGDYVVRGEQQVVERLSAILRSFERGEFERRELERDMPPWSGS